MAFSGLCSHGIDAIIMRLDKVRIALAVAGLLRLLVVRHIDDVVVRSPG